MPNAFNLSNTTPAPPLGSTNVLWQNDGSIPPNISAYVTGGTYITDYGAVLVQNNQASTTSCAFIFGNTAGNFLLVTIAGTSGNVPGAPTDTAVNTWHEVPVSSQSEGTITIRMFYAYNCLAYGLTGTGAVNTVSSTNAAFIEVYEFMSVYAGGDPYDVGSGASSQTTSGTSVNMKTAAITENYPGLAIIFGYAASGSLTNGTATVNSTALQPQFSGPTFAWVGYYVSASPQTVQPTISNNTNAVAYCAITASFRLAPVITNQVWFGRTNAGFNNALPNTCLYKGTSLYVGMPQNWAQVTWTYPVPIHVNGNFTMFLRMFSGGSADQWGYGMQNSGPRMLNNTFISGPNNWAFDYELYSSPGPTNSVGWFVNGTQTISFASTSPVSGNASHIFNILLSWTQSTKNMLFIMMDTTSNAIYKQNQTIDVAATVGTTGYPVFFSTTGGLSMQVYCMGYKFVGPSETVDYSLGFAGMGIGG